MASTQARFLAFYHRNRSISLPVMAPFASLVFLVVCYCLFNWRPMGLEAGIVRTGQLPATDPRSCWKGMNLDGAEGCVVSLNAKNQFSFALPEVGQGFQTVVIKELATKHGVPFTTSQLSALETLPFLATDIKKLPAFLDLPPSQRNAQLLSGAAATLSASQLAECIAITRMLTPKHLQYPIAYYLKVGADVKAPQVRRLTDLLQAQGINRFNLLTQSDE